MNRSKKRIGVIALAFLLIVFLVAVYAFHITKGKKETAITPEEAVKLIQNEFAILIAYSESANPLIREIYNHFSLEVQTINTDNNGGQIHCKVSTIELEPILTKIVSPLQSHSPEQMEIVIQNAFDQGEIKEETLVFEYEKIDDDYSVVFTSEQLDACTGGLLSFFEATYLQ